MGDKKLSDMVSEKAKNETVGDRVKIIRMGLGMYQRDFAKLLQMPQSNLSSVERNIRPLPRNALNILVKEGFSYNWIMKGIGGGKKLALLPVAENSGKAEDLSPREQRKNEILPLLDDLSMEELTILKGFILGLKKNR